MVGSLAFGESQGEEGWRSRSSLKGTCPPATAAPLACATSPRERRRLDHLDAPAAQCAGAGRSARPAARGAGGAALAGARGRGTLDHARGRGRRQPVHRRSGRVEVIDEGPPEVLVRVLRRGDVLGELALLREGTRSASARARRDTELLELQPRRVRGADPEAPSFALGADARDGRAAGGQPHADRAERRRRGRSRWSASTRRARSPRSPSELAARSWRRYGSIASLSAAASWRRSTRPSTTPTGWCCSGGSATRGGDGRALCLRDARPRDRGHERSSPTANGWRGPTALRGCELIVLGPPRPPRTSAALAPREVQVICGEPARRADAIESTAPAAGGALARASCCPAAAPARSPTWACWRSCARPACASTGSPASASARWWPRAAAAASTTEG